MRTVIAHARERTHSVHVFVQLLPIGCGLNTAAITVRRELSVRNALPPTRGFDQALREAYGFAIASIRATTKRL